MPECSTYEQIHKQIKDFTIIGGKKTTLKQKAFALMYSRYIDSPDDLPPIKNAPHLIFWRYIKLLFRRFIRDTPLSRKRERYTATLTTFATNR